MSEIEANFCDSCRKYYSLFCKKCPACNSVSEPYIKKENLKSVKSTESKIVLKFDNDKAAKHFATWLCEAGEQNYWQWMECAEEKDSGDITAIKFNYHGENESNKFMLDNIIRTVCGRLSK